MSGDSCQDSDGTGEFEHPAFFYRTAGEYLSGAGGFVREALALGHPLLVAVPGDSLDALRRAAGPRARSASWHDMSVLGRNPGRILAELRAFADAYADPAHPVRIIGEPIWPGRSPAEIREATRHEALINTAFAGRAAVILCPYDLAALPAAAIADARRTHPRLICGCAPPYPSPDYLQPPEVCSRCDTPLPEPPTQEPVTTLQVSTDGLAAIRNRTRTWARQILGLGRRAEDLVLAVHEAAANSLAHGGGQGVVRLWRSPEGAAVAEISDSGHLADPLAGRSRPVASGSSGGRGLWVIHQLCDLVETRSTPLGLTLRLHVAP